MWTDFFVMSILVKLLTLKLPMGWAVRMATARNGRTLRFISVGSDHYTLGRRGRIYGGQVGDLPHLASNGRGWSGGFDGVGGSLRRLAEAGPRRPSLG